MPDAAAMSPPPLQPDSGAEAAWFVQAAGRVWGPYSPARIVRFAAEGRVTPQSLLATQAEGPFHPAGRWRSLSPLFQPPGFQPPQAYHHQPAPSATAAPAAAIAASRLASRTGTQASPTPEPAQAPAPLPKAPPAQDRRSPSPSAAPLRPLLVWAELASLGADQFEALAARYGAVVAIRPSVWLVQAQCDAAALRNALSRRLTGADALIVVHAPLDQAAWFNLDGAAERRLRQIWGGTGS